MPSAESRSIQFTANALGHETSVNTPVQAAGTQADPCMDFRRKTAIWARVTGVFGQYIAGVAAARDLEAREGLER